MSPQRILCNWSIRQTGLCFNVCLSISIMSVLTLLSVGSKMLHIACPNLCFIFIRCPKRETKAFLLSFSYLLVSNWDFYEFKWIKLIWCNDDRITIEVPPAKEPRGNKHIYWCVSPQFYWASDRLHSQLGSSQVFPVSFQFCRGLTQLGFERRIQSLFTLFILIFFPFFFFFLQRISSRPSQKKEAIKRSWFLFCTIFHALYQTSFQPLPFCPNNSFHHLLIQIHILNSKEKARHNWITRVSTVSM